MSATSSSPRRSILTEGTNSSKAVLSTIKALLQHHGDRSLIPDAPALPFLVTRHFASYYSGRYHLQPGEFPDVVGDLGHGTSFIVQHAKLPDMANIQTGKHDNINVALKRIRPSRSTARTRQSFQEIISELICLTHEPLYKNSNVVTLLGLGWEVSPSPNDSRLWPYLILEYAAHGTLADLQNSDKILSYAEKKNIVLNIAEALGILHHCEIIHGDIKSENVLVFDNPAGGFIAKLSDFGYATLNIDFSPSQGSIKGTPKEIFVNTGTLPWTSPEFGSTVSWENAFKSDVYTWGLLVWRVFIDGANPFQSHEHLFKEVAGVRGASDVPNDLYWKSADIVLPAAKRFAKSVTQPIEDFPLEEVFEWTLKKNPQERDLQRAFVPWLFGPQYVKSQISRGAEAHYPFQLPLTRQLLFAGSDSFHGFLGEPFSFQEFQMLPPSLRSQFIEDLSILAQLESPLPTNEAHMCPTVTAAMILAEQNISLDEHGFAYDYVVQAANKGLMFAKALASRLEEYKNSQMVETELPSGSLLRFTGRRKFKQPDISDKILSWSYDAATLGSVSALEHIKSDKMGYAEALRTLRTCRLGGIQHLSMWTTLDASASREAGYLVAGSLGGNEILAKNILDKHEEDHCKWIDAGPQVGKDISFLHVSCAKGLHDAVMIILARGASVNSRFCPGRQTPLLLACMSGSSIVISTLLEYGADPSIANDEGETPLHWLSAFVVDDIPMVAKLLCQSKAQLSASARGSFLLSEGYFEELAFASGTPLHRAIGKRNVPAVQALLDLGADPLAKDDKQLTCFALAAMLHLGDILKMLHSRVPEYKANQDHGPNLRLFNLAINAANPLRQFSVHGHDRYNAMENTIRVLIGIGESLYGYNGEDNFIRNAIAVGNLRMVEFLLEIGAKEHMHRFDYGYGGNPALYHALILGHRWIFLTLLKHGADVNAEFIALPKRGPGSKLLLENRPNRSTYLHVCAEIGADVRFVRKFLQRGVPVNQPDADWKTALYLAIRAGYHDIAAELIEHGANLKEVLDGKTLLGQLASEGFGVSKDRFQFLLNKIPSASEAKLLAGPRDRQSIFHHLAQDGLTIRQPAWARDLLQFFIDQIHDRRLLDLQDTNMNTALHLAVRHGNSEVVRALVEARADYDLYNFDGFTPLALARNLHMEGSIRQKDIIRLLEACNARDEQIDKRTVSSDDSRALWLELGFRGKDDDWLDTALVQVLRQLQASLLRLFREDGFLLSENPWKSATKIVWDCVSTNTAILDKIDRTRDFEYATGMMLHGFVDVVTVMLQEDGVLLVKLVKPFNKRERKFPPGLLNPHITFVARTTGVGMTSFFHSDSKVKSLGIRPKEKEDLEQKVESSSASQQMSTSASSQTETLIRIRNLGDGRMVIERHDPDEQVDDGTGIMYIGPGNSFAQEIFGKKKE